MNRLLLTLACVLISVVSAGHAEGQSPVVVTPTSKPATIAAQLSRLPDGGRAVILKGFANDICNRDFLNVRTMSRGKKPVVVRVPSPWIQAGSRAVTSRVAGLLAALKRRSVRLDAVFLEQPGHAASDNLARGSHSQIAAVMKDPRFGVLRARYPAIASTSKAGFVPSLGAWQQVIRSEVRRQITNAHQSAVSAYDSNLRVVEWTSAMALPAKAGALPKAAATAPAAARPSVSPVAFQPTVGSQASAAPTGVVQPVSSARVADSVRSAAKLVVDRASSADLVGWQGQLSSYTNEWDELFQRASSSTDARRVLEASVQYAGSVIAAGEQAWKRPYRFADIPTEQVDQLSLSCGANRDIRALAMHDCRQAEFLQRQLLTLAIAARHSGNPTWLAYCETVLREVSTWDPFQRSGWSIGSKDQVLPQGGDGVNMATAWAITAVVDCMEVLGDRLSLPVREQLCAALRRELGYVVESWASVRPWYVKSNTVSTNQWIDPNVAAVRACLMLRDDGLRPIYEMAVQNLGMSLRHLQPDGAFLEGFTYAQMSLPTMFRAVESMARCGDDRLRSNAFVANSWKWMIQLQMPGGNIVSSGDSKLASLPPWAVRAPLDCIAYSALASGSDAALSTVAALFPESGTWPGAARYAAERSKVRPLSLDDLPHWSFFPSQQLVTWRERWTRPMDPSTAMAVWVKGGSLLENSHGQRDQGHVSVYAGHEPILIECGTPDYADPEYLSRFASVAGHGVMQVDPVIPSNRPIDAPVSVHQLDDNGGRLSIDLRNASRLARTCSRDVQWSSSGRVHIGDHVEFVQPIPAGTEVYRFHLGCAEPPEVSSDGVTWSIRWQHADIVVTPDRAVDVSVERVRNVTTNAKQHHALVVRLKTSDSSLRLSTSLAIHR